VIGPGDMGFEKGGEPQSYASAAILNGWLKELSKEQGFSYFDFYHLMQKDGGILGWKKKGWAGLDGHLTPTGQRIFAQKLTLELLTAYQKHRLTSGQKLIHPKIQVAKSKKKLNPLKTDSPSKSNSTIKTKSSNSSEKKSKSKISATKVHKSFSFFANNQNKKGILFC
jgi:hypothetical protein